MGFYMLLTVALLLTSFMSVEATPVDQAERSAMKESGLAHRIEPRYASCEAAEADCIHDDCFSEDTYTDVCQESCQYMYDNCMDD
uniref:Turripeptide IX-01 n=1 Tax=Gemmula speciosa TaxID=439592 RepID=TU91_GEMSP|nr:RecName: Full=Turripeptide IX-01; Flags: Precursor [Gemmula speciosa]ADE28866.1 putative turritoxin IX-01 precursor [Gemmula speciosa]